MKRKRNYTVPMTSYSSYSTYWMETYANTLMLGLGGILLMGVVKRRQCRRAFEKYQREHDCVPKE